MDLSWLIPYTPQLITAGSTLGAVVLTLLFTGRRERKKDAARRADEAKALFRDEKQETFAEFLNAASEFRDFSLRLLRVEAPSTTEELIREIVAQNRNIRTLENHITLIAPEAIVAVHSMSAIASELINLDLASPTAIDDWTAEYQDSLTEVRDEMRKSLGVEVVREQPSRRHKRRTGNPSPHVIFGYQNRAFTRVNSVNLESLQRAVIPTPTNAIEDTTHSQHRLNPAPTSADDQSRKDQHTKPV